MNPSLSHLKQFIEAAARPDSPLWPALKAEISLVPGLALEVLPALVKSTALRNPTLLSMVKENAREAPHELAFEMDDEKLTWSELDRLTSKIARLLANQGVRPGDNIALMGRNSPTYLALILGATRVGATTALINFNLVGAPLAHAFRTSKARVALVDQVFESLVSPALLPEGGAILSYGSQERDVERALRRIDAFPYPPARVSKDDDFVFIYTSGTTGLPKPCRVSHARALSAGILFGKVLFDYRPGDKLYSALPLYHASALLIGAGSAIAGRTPMAMRDSFSAKNFLSDVRRYDATATLYIGEICRYLLATPESPDDRRHRLRVAVGNGLRPDVWAPFQARFGVKDIREFYTATEAPGGIFNLSGFAGSVGRLPFDGFGLLKLAKFDVESESHVKSGDGFCVVAAAGEAGELLIKIPENMPIAGLKYRGYTDTKATESKILTNVFRPGDRYFRTGDLLRKDVLGFYQFVDRIGDTFRCKGENVSTNEVSDTLSTAPGISEINVVGVRIADLDGQFGLAAVRCEGDFRADDFYAASQELPAYAQPRFVRILTEMETTSTFKHQKGKLKLEGADPSKVKDALYLRDDAKKTYVPLAQAEYVGITSGRVRL